jgi:hypothetical protein
MTKRLYVRLAVSGVIIIAVIIGIKAAVAELNSPVVGEVSSYSATTKSYTAAVHINLSPTLHTGTIISYDYPSGMTAQPSSALTTSELENDVYNARDIKSWLLAINVSIPQGGTISGDSGYMLRKSDPSTYQESTYSTGTQTYTIFSDQTQSFAKTAYIMNGDKLATVSLSGDDQGGTTVLQTAFNNVLSSLRWR